MRKKRNDKESIIYPETEPKFFVNHIQNEKLFYRKIFLQKKEFPRIRLSRG